MNYEDCEENPWSEDYDEKFHEEDFELSEEELAKFREKEEYEGLSNEEIYEKRLEVGMKDEYEYDEVVGGRDKKPVLSALNKKKLSKYEMDELFNVLS